MSVAELHPEELFDKLVDGGLTESERQRLAVHLRVCAVCRFDYAARLDFQHEADGVAQRLAPELSRRPARSAPLPTTRRRPPRILVWGIAAAVMICASAALAAALGERPWQRLAAIFESPAPQASFGKGSGVKRAGKNAPQVTRAEVAVAPARPPSAEAIDPSPTPRVLAPRPAAPRRSSSPAVSITAPPVSKLVSSASTTDSSATHAFATPPGPATPAEPSGAGKLFAEANSARRASQVGRASGLYHLLQEQYPGSVEAELSRVTLATLLLNSGDASGALAGFERYLAGPSHALEAEALVGRARALERLGRLQPATAAWREVQHRFPGSIYARQAAERLTALVPP